MAADGKLLQGEINDSPLSPLAAEGEVERMLAGFLAALLAEQQPRPAR